ncbi:MAG: hypothetical protein QM650_08735 [Microlunatus sp.]
MYATDLSYVGKSDDGSIVPVLQRDTNFILSAERRWQWDWAFLATDNEIYLDTVADGPISIRGLKLDPAILKKIFYDNAKRIFTLTLT